MSWQDPGLRCVLCGRPLGFDPDDEPDGDGPDRPLCGECRRARDFDDLILRDMAGDGEFDGDFGDE
jgi:hypothetical protein